jgi:competence protein ComEC
VGRALLAAVLLGDRGEMRPEAFRRLRDAGLVHLVAISGLHVGILAALTIGLLRRLGISPPLLLAATVVSLPLFASLVGGRPPVTRAALGVGMVLAGRTIGRETDSIHLLPLIAAGLVAGMPALLGDPGFQLTFVATAGILIGAPTLSRCLPLPRPLASALAVTAAAYLSTAPLIAFHFGRVAPVALVSNLAAAPLCAALLVTGYASILLHGVPLAGEWIASCSNVLACALLDLAARAAGISGGAWRVPPPSPSCLALYYGMALTLFLPCSAAGARCFARRHLRASFALLVVWVHLGPAPPGAGEFRTSILEIGQGQCVVLHAPRGETILVDAGGAASPGYDPGERVVLPYLDASAVRRVEALAVSHGDIDHAGGAFAVLREREVGELWLPPGFHEHPRLRALARLAAERGTSLVLAERGARFQRGGLTIRVLSPDRGPGDLSTNDRSLVLLAGREPARILVAGDLERSGERDLLATGQDCAAELLVVGHHGARNGTGAPFLERVRPRHAIASCGYRNRFGHPHAETLARIDAAGARLWRTDRDGMLETEAARGGWRITPRRRSAARE